MSDESDFKAFDDAIELQWAEEIKQLRAKVDRLSIAGDALAESLQRNEEQFYAHYFEEGVVTKKVREYVSEHSALVAWEEARREQ